MKYEVGLNMEEWKSVKKIIKLPLILWQWIEHLAFSDKADKLSMLMYM